MPRKKQGRNSNGESSIYLGADKRWHGRVTVGVKDNGRPDRRHVSAKDRAEVVRKVRELERKRDEGTVQKAGTSWTVAQWLDHWLNDIAVMTTTENGWDAYYYAVKHLVPGVGAHRLNKLAPHHLESLYRKMLANGSRKGTVHQVHRTIRAALNDAVARDFLTKNPAKVAKAPTPDEEEIEPFTKDEIRALFTAARKERNSTRWIIAIALGLRQGEALALQWSDLDFEEQTLKIRRSQLRPKYRHGCEQPCGRKHAGHCPQRVNVRPETKDTKSKAGKRIIGLPAPLIEELERHRDEQQVEREQARDLWQDEGWIFADQLGRRLNARTDQFHWKRLLDAAGVRDARLHDARHTAATVLLELGVTDRATMGVMGWSNASMAGRYQHLTAPIRRSIADQVGGHLWGNHRYGVPWNGER
ncbi:site-specific recombinase XerD [Prauserella shujinwangii]|uniref:Site-specific recombinase XerD n=1 Tax=Prauserella shujinwangii TaxID=1453103 RepID=A0A2T0LVS5_9PSEU|nr:site-specific integrase [Prauserella shujinwangii]PRX47950.1 site-specific recombinase XerD [Prauserella shujinwangii]